MTGCLLDVALGLGLFVVGAMLGVAAVCLLVAAARGDRQTPSESELELWRRAQESGDST